MRFLIVLAFLTNVIFGQHEWRENGTPVSSAEWVHTAQANDYTVDTFYLQPCESPVIDKITVLWRIQTGPGEFDDTVITEDDSGGIYISWTNPDTSVLLDMITVQVLWHCPETGKKYQYTESRAFTVN